MTCWREASRRATLPLGRPEWPAPPQSHTMAGTVKPHSRTDDPPGRHTLQMVLGDHLHIPHDPPIASSVVTIEVQ